jgi:hypothetical protein
MDSDGEDRPEDVLALIEAHRSIQQAVIVAERSDRTEGLVFQLFYLLYKGLFALLTGRVINFGNFCLLPAGALQRVIYSPDTWSHLAASLLKSRLQLLRIRLPRGSRYEGHPKMTFIPLIALGLSAIAVFRETVFIRVLLVTLGISMSASFGLIVVFALRLATDLAIPGWASTLSALLMVILLQALMFSGAAAILLLSFRSTRDFIPAQEALRYVRDRSKVAAG